MITISAVGHKKNISETFIRRGTRHELRQNPFTYSPSTFVVDNSIAKRFRGWITVTKKATPINQAVDFFLLVFHAHPTLFAGK